LLQFEEIIFDELELNLPPQCVFDLPHARAINVIFVINLTVGKYSYDMGNLRLWFIKFKTFIKYLCFNKIRICKIFIWKSGKGKFEFSEP